VGIVVLYPFVISATAASVVGFSFHVVTMERIQSWISAQMSGKKILASRNVLVPAAVTSLEMGIGLVILYTLVRNHLPFENAILRGVVLGLLILSVGGKLFRQPLMNWLVGTPIKVVLIQGGITWLNWILMSVTTALIYEALL